MNTNDVLKLVPLDNIVTSITNPRKNFKGPDWPNFVNNIRTHGVIQPGVGRMKEDGKVELVSGERRYRASVEAQMKVMPLIIQSLSDAQAVEIQQIENLQRADLSPMEEAQGYADWRDTLMKSGECRTAEEAVAHIAERIDRKRTAVWGKLALLRTAPAVQAAVAAGKLDASKAGLIAQIPDPKDQAQVLKEITEPDADVDPMSYRDLKELIQTRYRVNLKGAPFSQNTTFTSVKLDGKPAPTCKVCPYRIGNMVNVEGDPNVCTNPECFRAKCGATASSKSAAIAEIWDEKTYQKNRYNNDYVTANTSCWEDDGDRTWEEVLGKFAPAAIYALAGSGRGEAMNLTKIWKREEVLKIAKDNKLLKVNAPQKPSAEKSKRQKDREAEAAKEEARDKATEALLVQIVGGGAHRTMEMSTVFFWRNMAQMTAIGFLRSADDDELQLVMKGHGMGHAITDDAEANVGAIQAKLATEPSWENLLGYTVEFLLRRANAWRSGAEPDAMSEREKMIQVWSPFRGNPITKAPGKEQKKPAAKKPAKAAKAAKPAKKKGGK